jgi:hypothetical protein
VDLQRAGSVIASISVQLGRFRTVRTDQTVQLAEKEGHNFQIWNFSPGLRFVVILHIAIFPAKGALVGSDIILMKN